MPPVSLTIPEAPRELPEWLEAHLLGTQLGELVAELSAIHGAAGPTRTLDETCEGRLDEVLKRGLSVLPGSVLTHLLQQPELLLDLQDAILQHGGPHWFRQPVSRDRELALAAQWNGLVSELGLTATTSPARPISMPHPSRGIGRSLLVAIASAAATVAVVWFQGGFVRPAPSGWGWDRPGALAGSLPPRGYLEQLATAAEDWFKKRPESRPDLARRIAQFRQGCSTLILADHAALAPADRDWLRERCRVWAGKLDAHLAALEAGDDIEAVRKAADETVNRLISAIRERAQSVG